MRYDAQEAEKAEKQMLCDAARAIEPISWWLVKIPKNDILPFQALWVNFSNNNFCCFTFFTWDHTASMEGQTISVMLVKPDRVIYIHFFMLILKIKFLICIFHSDQNFFFTRLPPGDQILIFTKKSNLGVPKMSKNCLQNFWFWHWPNLSNKPNLALVLVSFQNFLLVLNFC